MPVLALAERAGLRRVVDEHVTVPTDRGAHAGAKVAALVAGMVAGADSIEDMNLLRHGGMPRLFTGTYAPSTLGSFLRSFAFGHVRQLDAVAARLVAKLAEQTPLLPDAARIAYLDVDDTVRATYGYAKQGAGYGYSGVKGLNALLADVVDAEGGAGDRRVPAAEGLCELGPRCRPAGRRRPEDQPRVRRERAAGGACGLGVLQQRRDRRHPPCRRPLLSHRPAGHRGAARYRLDPRGCVDDDPLPARRASTSSCSSGSATPRSPRVEFTAFASRGRKHAVTARLIVRRVRDANPDHVIANDQGELFPAWRHHAVFTDSPLTMLQAEADHRRHAIIEQVIADLKNGPLAHLPSGRFNANGAWLVLAAMAFNLTRAAGTLASRFHARATTATIRRQLINVPARPVRSARRVHLRLPANWPWAADWLDLFTAALGPPPTAAA